jgi:hypothetical protein
MRFVARIATATVTATVLAGLSLAGAAPALACDGTAIAVNGYGVCAEESSTTVPGRVVWTPGVPKQYVNTPGVLFIPPQSVGTPIVPSQGVTAPTLNVDGVSVTPCTGSC